MHIQHLVEKQGEDSSKLNQQSIAPSSSNFRKKESRVQWKIPIIFKRGYKYSSEKRKRQISEIRQREELKGDEQGVTKLEKRGTRRIR